MYGSAVLHDKTYFPIENLYYKCSTEWFELWIHQKLIVCTGSAQTFIARFFESLLLIKWTPSRHLSRHIQTTATSNFKRLGGAA